MPPGIGRGRLIDGIGTVGAVEEAEGEVAMTGTEGEIGMMRGTGGGETTMSGISATATVKTTAIQKVRPSTLLYIQI